MSDTEAWIGRWRLEADGEAVVTHASRVVPVRTADGVPAMLKVATEAGSDERTAEMLRHYDGKGAVRLLRAEGPATLMERADGTASLKRMALAGGDAAAAAIICDVVRRLHGADDAVPEGLPELAALFGPLFAAAAGDAVFAGCAASAERLIAEPGHVVLHGDIHHENILDSARGWLAIDPKGRLGPPVYDYANLFLNPIHEPGLVHDPARMRRLAGWIGAAAGLDPALVLTAAHAHAGLAVVWFGPDRTGAGFGLRCVELLADCGGRSAEP